MWRNLRPYPDAKLQPWPPPSASGRGSSLYDSFAVRRLIQPRLSERQPSSRVGDGEREARGRVEPGCRHRRHRSARVAPCRIAEARSQARGPSSVAALVTKESSRGGGAHDRSSGKGVAGVGRSGRARSWLCDSAIRPAAGAKAVVPSSGRARVDLCEKQWRRGLLAGDGRQPPFVRNNKLEPTLASGDVEAARTSQARQRPASGRRPLPLSRFPQLMARSVPSRPKRYGVLAEIELAPSRGDCSSRGNAARVPSCPQGRRSRSHATPRWRAPSTGIDAMTTAIGASQIDALVWTSVCSGGSRSPSSVSGRAERSGDCSRCSPGAASRSVCLWLGGLIGACDR